MTSHKSYTYTVEPISSVKIAFSALCMHSYGNNNIQSYFTRYSSFFFYLSYFPALRVARTRAKNEIEKDEKKKNTKFKATLWSYSSLSRRVSVYYYSDRSVLRNNSSNLDQGRDVYNGRTYILRQASVSRCWEPSGKISRLNDKFAVFGIQK